nr:hypothetical protein [Streptomyces nitrosporeus]
MRDPMTDDERRGAPRGRPGGTRVPAPDGTAPVAPDGTASVAPDEAAPVALGGTTPVAPGGTASAAPESRAPEIAGHSFRRAGARRGSADPGKALTHRHRDLRERTAGPLETAAGLEARGVTDRAAAGCRRRDVFSPAEGLHAREPGTAGSGCPTGPTRSTGPARPAGPASEARAAGRALLALLPGAACLATAGVLRLTEGILGGRARFAVTAAGALLVLAGLKLCLRGGPLCTGPGSRTALYVCWLLGYAVYGDDLLAQVISGGPEGGWHATPAPLLGLALAVAPAVWCARLYAVPVRRAPAGNHAPAESGAGVRPLLFGVVALQTGATTALLHLAGLGYGGGPLVAPAALGTLIFLARLLAVHGFPEPGATALAAACATETAAVCLVLAGRLPGLGLLSRPVDLLVAAAGPGGVPVLACGTAALGLLIHAPTVLTRASAHANA